MKSSKNLQRQYGNSERKGGSSKREKGSKLDRKSSRGMIYENEELRLRTININAEVERGQSDIKRLRRENEQLRREIWTLRDECDRLNKRFKAKLLDHDHAVCNARHSACSGRGSVHVCDSTCNSDDSDSCDTCKGNDDQCSDECCTGGSCPQLAIKQPIIEFASDTPTAPAPHNADKSTLVAKTAGSNSESAPNLHQAFDHLSVVSEETMSNAELHSHVPHNEMLHVFTSDLGGSQMTLPSLVGPLTPLTPIEQVANQLNDLQAVVPPLSYFENVLHDHMGSNIGNTPNTSSPSSKIMRHTNGWDYKLQSPFAHRKISTGLSPPALQIATPHAMNAAQQQQSRLAPPQLLTTFVPTVVASLANNEVPPNPPNLSSVSSPSAHQPHMTAIETVAITTTAANAISTLNSPKHFFAPLKPRLKLNTALANQIPTTATNVPGEPAASNSTPTTNSVADAEIANCKNCEPPDLYVHNGLASPYQRQELGEDHAMPPPIPQRGSSSQVSPQHRARAHHQYQQVRQQTHQHLHPHQYTHQHQQQHQRLSQHQQKVEHEYERLHLQSTHALLAQSLVTITVTADDADEVAAGADTVAACGTDAASAAVDTALNAFASASSTPINMPSPLQVLSLPAGQRLPSLKLLAAMPTVFVAQPNAVATNLCEPIYATAQKRCKNLLISPALTKPLMTAAINPNNRLTPTTSNMSSATATPAHSPLSGSVSTTTSKANLVDGECQVNGVHPFRSPQK